MGGHAARALVVVVALASGCSGPAMLGPSSRRVSLGPMPAPAPNATAPVPTKGGSGTAPVSGIRKRNSFLGLFRTGTSPFEMPVRIWSAYFARALDRELKRVSLEPRATASIQVWVKSLRVRIPRLSGGVTCTLKVEAIVTESRGGRRIHPIAADGKAGTDRDCITNASGATLRHILTAPWFTGVPAAHTSAPVERGPEERAGILPGTRGRYGFLWSLHLGVGRAQLDDTERRTTASFGVTFGIGLTKNLFFTSNVYSDAASKRSETEIPLSAGAIGFGLAYYLDSSVRLSGAFMVGLPNDKASDFEGPGLGGQLMVGKEWRVSKSIWLGGAIRAFSNWSLEDGGRLMGLTLMSTAVFN